MTADRKLLRHLKDEIYGDKDTLSQKTVDTVIGYFNELAVAFTNNGPLSEPDELKANMQSVKDTLLHRYNLAFSNSLVQRALINIDETLMKAKLEHITLVKQKLQTEHKDCDTEIALCLAMLVTFVSIVCEYDRSIFGDISLRDDTQNVEAIAVKSAYHSVVHTIKMVYSSMSDADMMSVYPIDVSDLKNAYDDVIENERRNAS